jgi:hypothetical protein
MSRNTFLLRALVPLGAIACALAAFPAHGASNDRRTSRACAAAKGPSSSAASASASSRSSTAPVARNDDRQPNAAHGAISSSVTSGPNGLSGTTTMPDGSTITVAPGRGTSSSAVASSGGSRGSASASSESAADDECIDAAPRGSTKHRPQQNGKQPKPQKENRP